ncbi:hypothetical protein GS461_21350 [Rhodococcus hoagii]|nr:hypothetical protein [Prescottella equi]
MVSWNGDRRIVPYSIRVERDLRYNHPPNGGELFTANFDGNGGDLLKTISAFVEALPSHAHIDRDNRHFGKPSDVCRKGRTICWRMDGGESGRQSSIVLSRGDREQQRQLSGIEWAPFWVMAVVPENANHGWLLIEKDGRHTLPTEWRKELIKQFATVHKGYRLAISTIREESLWSTVENALDEPRVLGFEVAVRAPDGRSAHGYTRGMAEVNRKAFRSTDGPVPGRALRMFRRNYTGTQGPKGVREVDYPMEHDDLSDGDVKIRLREDVVEIKATVINAQGLERTIVFEGLDAQQTFVMEGTSDGQPSQHKFETECAAVVSDLASSGGVPIPRVGIIPSGCTPQTHPR